MRRLAAVSFACALAALPLAARADQFSTISYGLHVSTIGDGVTLEKPLLYNLSVRIATGAMSVSEEFRYDDTPYTSTTKYNNVALIADYRPYAGRYRISGGLVLGNDHIDNVARPDGASLRIGSGLYPAAGVGAVTARVHFDRPSLYAGVGTGTGLIHGLALAFDAGVLIRNGSTSAEATGPLASDPAFRADLERLRNEQRTHVVVPVISIGLVFRP